MLISVDKNFIFIHVAKTGGQAIKRVLRPHCVVKAPGQWRRLLSHLPVREGPDAQFGPHASARWAKLKLDRDFFEGAFKFAIVRNPYDLAVSRYSFVRGAAKHHRHRRAGTQTFRDFLRSEKRRAMFRWTDQTSMLYDRDGRLLVDKVYRFEEIADAYRDIVARLDLQDAPELTRQNASEREDYRTYYGADERQLVEQIWARDFVNFGYRF